MCRPDRSIECKIEGEIMPTDIPPLTDGNFYHIYNRGNNHENIFLQERNYAYFLELWWKHTRPIAETWAYCLLRNHFHAVVYIKNREDLTGLKVKSVNRGAPVDKGANPAVIRGDLSGLKDLSKYFSNFFNAYARGFNIATQRTGALFERPFKRIPVDSTAYLMQLIVYVHQNPQKHRFTEDFREWKHSSYHLLTSDISSRLQRERIMQLFGSREDFVRIHQEIQPWDGLEDVE
jgi:REP-associated tyrosine transposase